MRTVSIPLAVLSILTVVMCGCVTVDGPQINMLPVQEEIALGDKMAKQVEEEHKVLPDTVVQDYVRKIGGHMAQFSPRTDVTFQFTVIDDLETVNAFALPGGHLYFYTGLLKLCQNEAEMAAVMAHEIAHVAEYHHGEGLTRAQLASMVAGMLLGDNPSQFKEISTQLVGASALSFYSRQNENEADRLGMQILYQGGYDPTAMITFMEKMMAEEKKRGGVYLPIFASHPATTERMERLGALAAQFPPGYNVLNAERYQQSVLSRIAE